MKKKTASGISLTLLLTSMLTLAFNIQPVKASGTVIQIGIAVYWDFNCSVPTSFVDWEMLKLGESRSTTVHIKNEGDQNVTLSLDTANWLPAFASNYVSLSWDYSGELLEPSQIENVILTLSVSVSIKDVDDFSFDITISAKTNGLTASIAIASIGAVFYSRVHNIDTGKNYTTIQEAIDDPETLDGHTILVDAGTYYEHIVVNKSVSLIGENKDTTIIDGNGTGNAIYISANNVKLSGFTVLNSPLGSGIVLFNSNNCMITGNNMHNIYYTGIRLAYSENCTVSENLIYKNFIGIYLISSSYNMLNGNTVSNNSDGIELDESDNCDITGNTVNNSYYSGVILLYSSNCTIIGNSINNNRFGVNLFRSNDNVIYHNNFITNWRVQANADPDSSNNAWDDGYPSGGNYWSDYTDVDHYSGPCQNETGGDGIWDHPYIIDENNQDNYPLMEPWSPKTLLGAGWGWMRIAPREYVYGWAELYKIGETQIELVITYKGEHYSRKWNIIYHREYKYGERYLCYSEEWGFLIVGLHKHRRWQFWYAVGKGVIAFGFPRHGRLRLMPI